MKKILCVTLLVFLLVNSFVSCVSTSTSNNGAGESLGLDSSNTTSTPSERELAEMYEQAVDYEKHGKFRSAINIYRELYTYGFADPEFGYNGNEKALEIREKRYLFSSMACKYIKYAVGDLKSNLKDPNSLVIYGIKLYDSTGNTFVITLDYGAKNSFGGMVRDTYNYTHILSTYEQDQIYSIAKEHMDQIGCTTSECAEYLAGNCSPIFYSTVYEAIVNGTCDY